MKVVTQSVPRQSLQQVLAGNYLEAGEPVLIEGGLQHAAALRRWTLPFLRERFGSMRVPVSIDLPLSAVPYRFCADDHDREMPLSEFLDLLQSPDGRPCYMHAILLDQFDTLGQDLEHGHLVGFDTGYRFSQIWIGSRDTRSGLHLDGDHNLFTQVMGRKHVFLVPPEQSPLVYPLVSDFCKSQVDVEAFANGRGDARRFPGFQRALLMEAIVHPGDVLFIPALWWHHLRSLDISISVSHHLTSSFSLLAHARLLGSLGPVYGAAVARQFVVEGLLGRKPVLPLYSRRSPGKMLYDFARERLRAALGRS